MKKQKKIGQNSNDLDVFQQLAGTMDFFIEDMKEMNPKKYKGYIAEANRMKQGFLKMSEAVKAVEN
jgi:nitrogen regulatory protein PII-like uncharacterized protein